MSHLGDVGISPVLLQAISQSITSTSHSSRDPTPTSNMENTNNGGSLQRQPLSEAISDKGQEINSEAVKTMLKIKMAANAITKSLMNDDGTFNLAKGDNKTPFTTSTISDLAMANMLTALASQSGTSVVSSNGGAPSVSGVRESAGTSTSNVLKQRIYVRSKSGELIQQSLATDEGKGLTSSRETEIKQEMDQDSHYASEITSSRLQASAEPIKSSVDMNIDSLTGSQSRFFIKSKPSENVESQSVSVSVSQSEQDPMSATVLVSNIQDQTGTVLDTVIIPQGKGQLIEYGGKQYILHPSSTDSSSKFIAVRTSEVPSTSEESEIYTTVGGHEIVTVTEGGDTDVGMNVGLPTMQVYTTGDGPKINICPICGDEISGFHYGIFTCESCKGFFKRTVQNKKSFVCHRQGECEITLENRKKCPACRFAKCLVMGMKLDAIRQDRSRGGRSSYSGLSPLDEAKRKRQMKPVQKRPISSPSTSDSSRLASALSYDAQSVGKPFVPPVLTDIMNLESLLCDDDIPQNIKADDFIASNPSVFLTLLQLCELKLYKIVRWARNLPYFANISTDDQILLLQNCWCELLALTMCWKSIHLTNEIVFFHGQTIDLEKARLLTLGDMFLCMLAEVEQLKRLKLDQYEFVAMKVIILITPDIKGLNDADRLGLQQQKISEALEQYTSSHYKQNPSKYGELLLRLPELSRISFMLKEQLLSWMPHDNTSCGLLYELLKGENMKELV